jgi:hypothetical protein
MRYLILILLSLAACADSDDTLIQCDELCPDAVVYFCTDATGAMCACVSDPVNKPDHYENCTAQTSEGSGR